MIIAWWDKEHPEIITLCNEDALSWINANWVEKRPATEEEIRMFAEGKTTYKIKED